MAACADAGGLAAHAVPDTVMVLDHFGTPVGERCMFESNFPVDRVSVTYRDLYNAFKLMVADFSDAEKGALFSGTARRVYRLPALPTRQPRD